MDIRDLFFLVGKWNCEGRIIESEDGPSIPISGVEAYAWVQGGKYLEHRVSVMMGEAQVEVVELIGNSEEFSDTYPVYVMENGEMTVVMQARLNDGRLTLFSDNMRAAFVLSEDERSMSAYWERSDNGKEWVPWMELNFLKQV